MAKAKTEAQIAFTAQTEGFVKGVKAVNDTISTVNAALKLNSTQLKANADDVDLLSERHKLLSDKLDEANTKVELIESQLAVCKDTLGENSEEYRKLERQLLAAKTQQEQANQAFKASKDQLDAAKSAATQTETAYEKLEKTIDSQESELDGLKTAYKDVVIAQGKNSDEAKALAGEIDKLSGELSDNKKKMSDAEKAADDLDNTLEEVGDSASEAGDGFTVAKGAIAGFISNGLTAIVGAAKNAISSLASLAEETREYRTELAKIETVAEGAGVSTDYIKDKWLDLGTVLGDEGAVAEGLNNLVTAGFTTQEQMDAITSHLEGAAIKWKDTLKFEGLADGLQETLATGAAVGPFSELLERAGVNLESFNEGLADCTTEADKQNYILDQLSKLGLNEVSEAYRKQNEDIIAAEKAQANYNDKLATLGEKIEPVTTAVTNGFGAILDKVIELLDGVDTEAISQTITGGFQDFIDNTLPKIVDGFQWVIDNKDIIIAGLAGIGAGFAVFKVASVIEGVVSAVKAFKLANEGATISQALLNAVMNANPIVLVASLVAGLVVAIGTFLATNEDARKKIAETWEKIKTSFSEAIEGVKQKFEDFKGKIDNVKQKFVDFKTNVINTINTLKSNVTTKFNEIKDKIMTPVNTAKTKVEEAVKKIKNIFDFKWSLPPLKIPKISVSGGEAPYGIAGKGKLPSFSIKWNKEGGVFTKPTVLQGFGEAGTEYALPLNERSLEPLAALLNKMTMGGENGLVDILASRFDNAVNVLAERLERLEAKFYLDGEQFATATAGYNDSASGARLQLAERGLAVR